MEKIILTRRVQLIINSRDKEVLKTYYDQMYEYQRLVCYAANMINTHLFLQDRLRDLVYLTTETKVKLADAMKDEDGILTTSHMNSIYRLLSANFLKLLPSSTLSNLNQALYRTYQSNREVYWRGEKSMPNYRKDIPIPFSNRDMTLHEEEGGKNFTFTLFKIPFKTYLGRDRSGMRMILRKIANGELPLRQSAIQMKNNKIYLLASLEAERQRSEPDPSLIAEVSLSMEYPLVVKIGREEFQIGNKEEFLYRRLSIQAARRRLQIAATWNKGGKGKKRKLKSLENYSEKEKNYIESRLHLYSRRLIDHCQRAGAGTILLVNQSYKEEVAKGDTVLLRNWSYYGLKTKIAYKAKLANILLMEE
ncbi:MAG: hypothetical protein KF870_07015 [Leadbetterella sp.]|nr:hypothetical protein [Leadbetterella sp.]